MQLALQIALLGFLLSGTVYFCVSMACGCGRRPNRDAGGAAGW